MADSGYNTTVHGMQGGGYLVLGTDADGLPVILCAGQADTDGAIVTAIGADTLFADGSIYVSCATGAGKLFLKTNDVWVDEKV